MDERKNVQFIDYVKDGIWTGHRCFIVGGGLSLKTFDWSKLKGELVIAINRAHEYCDPSIIIAQDARVFIETDKGIIDPRDIEESIAARNKIRNFGGYCLYLQSGKTPAPTPYCYTIKRHKKNRCMPRSLKDGLGNGENTGFGALNLALCLGASPIYLLGFDMVGKDGKQANFHSGYKWPQKDKVYRQFMQAFKTVEKDVNERAEIVNLNPNSAMESFRRSTWEQERIDKIERPVVVSYYTVDNGYENEIGRLHRSLHLFGLEHYIEGRSSKGSWSANVKEKTRFILEMLYKFCNKPVVWLDSDAEIVQYPEMFDRLCLSRPSVAVYWLNASDIPHRKQKPDEPGTGTVFFGNRRTESIEIVKQWVEKDKKYPNIGNQLALRDVLESRNRVNTVGLPPEYLAIDRIMDSLVSNPVVKHFQASRRLKRSK